MIDREKVIKGLRQHCDGSMFDRCGECPYYEIDDKPFECRDALLEDALTLLKADQLELIRQRDRIETLERIVDHLEQSVKESLQYLKILAMRR